MGMLKQCVVLVLLVTATGCSSAETRKQRTLDLAAVEHGEIFTDWVEVAPNNFMLRLVAMVDAPRDRLLNVFADAESLPSWDSSFQDVRIIRQEGETTEMVVNLNGPPGVSLAPLTMRSRLDRQRGEVALAAYENEWLRSLTWVNKMEQMGGPDRTMLTIYARSDIKAVWGRIAASQQAGRLAQSVRNLRRVVLLQKYAETPAQPAPAQVAPRIKVLVPAFSSGSLTEDLRDTLARVCAEQLMRHTTWSVMTHTEVAALLTYAHQKELAGCTGGSACTMDVGRTLEAERLVVGNVGKIGNEYVLDLTLITVLDGSIDRRASVRADSESELVNKVRDAVQALLPPGVTAVRASPLGG